MADVGTVTGPDYGANQVGIIIYHNYEAAGRLQKLSWLNEQCVGPRLPPSLWVRYFMLMMLGGGGGYSQYTHTHSHTSSITLLLVVVL